MRERVGQTVYLNSAKDLNDPLLVDYPPSERRAILVHRYYLGIELKKEPALSVAIRSWEDNHARPWRRKKTRNDVKAQLKEIQRHKDYLSQKTGEEVGWEEAASDWIRCHAEEWRDWWENQPTSCP